MHRLAARTLTLASRTAAAASSPSSSTFPLIHASSRPTLAFNKWALQTRKMQIQSIPMRVGSGDNYAYLVVDDKTKDAAIVDPAYPAEVVPLLKQAIENTGVKLKAIINTHHHRDHAGGNAEIREAFGMPNLEIIGGRDCAGVTRTPAHNESFSFGEGIRVTAVHTPCHTQDSVCWYLEDEAADQRAVLTGDTLFVGGCGRFFEGTPEEMHEALNVRLGGLPDDTKVYCGHEYTTNNVKFAKTVAKSQALSRLESYTESNTETTGVFTIGDEKKHNVFMRVTEPELQEATGETDPVKVMGKLRAMKDSF